MHACAPTDPASKQAVLEAKRARKQAEREAKQAQEQARRDERDREQFEATARRNAERERERDRKTAEREAEKAAKRATKEAERAEDRRLREEAKAQRPDRRALERAAVAAHREGLEAQPPPAAEDVAVSRAFAAATNALAAAPREAILPEALRGVDAKRLEDLCHSELLRERSWEEDTAVERHALRASFARNGVDRCRLPGPHEADRDKAASRADALRAEAARLDGDAAAHKPGYTTDGRFQRALKEALRSPERLRAGVPLAEPSVGHRASPLVHLAKAGGAGVVGAVNDAARLLALVGDEAAAGVDALRDRLKAEVLLPASRRLCQEAATGRVADWAGALGVDAVPDVRPGRHFTHLGPAAGGGGEWVPNAAVAARMVLGCLGSAPAQRAVLLLLGEDLVRGSAPGALCAEALRNGVPHDPLANPALLGVAAVMGDALARNVYLRAEEAGRQVHALPASHRHACLADGRGEALVVDFLDAAGRVVDASAGAAARRACRSEALPEPLRGVPGAALAGELVWAAMRERLADEDEPSCKRKRKRKAVDAPTAPRDGLSTLERRLRTAKALPARGLVRHPGVAAWRVAGIRAVRVALDDAKARLDEVVHTVEASDARAPERAAAAAERLRAAAAAAAAAAETARARARAEAEADDEEFRRAFLQ